MSSLISRWCTVRFRKNLFWGHLRSTKVKKKNKKRPKRPTCGWVRKRWLIFPHFWKTSHYSHASQRPPAGVGVKSFALHRAWFKTWFLLIFLLHYSKWGLWMTVSFDFFSSAFSNEKIKFKTYRVLGQTIIFSRK